MRGVDVFRRYIVPPLLSEPKRLAAVLVALVVLSVAQAAFILLLGPFLKVLFMGKDTYLDLATLVPEGVARYGPTLPETLVSTSQLAVLVPVLLLAAGLARTLAMYVYRFNQEALSLGLARSLRDKIFAGLMQQAYLKTASRGPGYWMSLIMNDVTQLQIRFSQMAATLVRDGAVICSSLIAVAMIHPFSAMVIAVLAPVIAVAMGRSAKKVSYYAESWQRALAQMAAAVLDIRKRYPFIRSQKGEGRELQNFEQLNSEYYRMIRGSILLRSAFAPMLELVGFGSFALVIYLISRGHLSSLRGESLIQFLAALAIMLRPLRGIGEQWVRLAETKGAMLSNFGIILGESQATPASDESFSAPLPDLIEIKKIVIRYESTEGAKALQIATGGISLGPGESLAITGPSGSGKSTVVRSLAGLIPPVTFECNVPWSEFSRSAVFVSQHPFMFSGSLHDNIAYGERSAPDEELLKQHIQGLCLTEVITGLPGGIHGSLDAIAANLSGGQLQRLSILRALLSPKRLWLFDEATSALDPELEGEIVGYIKSYARAVSARIIWVTHRMHQTVAFDQHLVFKAP